MSFDNDKYKNITLNNIQILIETNTIQKIIANLDKKVIIFLILFNIL